MPTQPKVTPKAALKATIKATEDTEVLVILTMREMFLIDEALRALCSHQLDKHSRTRCPQAAAIAQEVNNARMPILEARDRLHRKTINLGKEDPNENKNTQPTRRKATHRRKAADTVR